MLAIILRRKLLKPNRLSVSTKLSNMKAIDLRIGIILLILSNANFLFSQSYEDSDEGLYGQFNLGFGPETYNNKTKGSAFSFEVGGGYNRVGGFLEVNINQPPTLDNTAPNYINLASCQIFDFKLLVHFYPFKVRKIFTPYLEAGPGYSYLEKEGKVFVAYNNPLYNVGASSLVGQYFMAQLGGGLMIVSFKHLSLKAEYSRSFFRNPDYLNGQQLIFKFGIHNWIE